jgi:glycerol-3-phosphate dehydrogenase
LLDDGASKAQEATRDYVLTLEAPALLSVFGGKITTYRRLAEAAMAKVARNFPGMRGGWTAGVALPGGDFPWDGIDQVRGDLASRYRFLSDVTCHRLVRAYGTLAVQMMGDARSVADMGRCLGADLTEREVDWLVRAEWARTAADVLWRRSKLGLRFGSSEIATLEKYLNQNCDVAIRRPVSCSPGS